MIPEALVSRKAPKQRLILFSLCAAALLCVAAFGAHLCPYDPYAQQYDAVLQAPGWDHWLGPTGMAATCCPGFSPARSSAFFQPWLSSP